MQSDPPRPPPSWRYSFQRADPSDGARRMKEERAMLRVRSLKAIPHYLFTQHFKFFHLSRVFTQPKLKMQLSNGVHSLTAP